MEISITGTDAVYQRVRKLLNIEDRLLVIAKRLCEVGEPIVRQTHGSHARIWSEQTKDGYKVVAEGEDLLFIEFGTGDMAGVMSPMYDAVPASARPGSWSEQHAQMYSKYGFWVFGGQIYHYTEPHPAFYYAYQAMIQALPQIVQDVMK